MTERDPKDELASIARGVRRYIERERAAGRGDLLAREGVIAERRVRDSGVGGTGPALVAEPAPPPVVAREAPARRAVPVTDPMFDMPPIHGELHPIGEVRREILAA